MKRNRKRREDELGLDLDIALIIQHAGWKVRRRGDAPGDRHRHLVCEHAVSVGKVYAQTSVPGVARGLLGAVHAVRHKYVDIGFPQELQAAVLDFIRQRLRREEFVVRVHEGHVQLWLDELELGCHFDADGTYAMGYGCQVCKNHLGLVKGVTDLRQQ